MAPHTRTVWPQSKETGGPKVLEERMTEGDTSPPAQEFEVVTEALLHGRQAKIGGVIEAELEGI